MSATGFPEVETAHEERTRLHVVVRGVVQGVGFRPFVFRLARELRLDGFVMNSAAGVVVEVEGAPAASEEFLVRLAREKPERASIQSLEHFYLDAMGHREFSIRESQEAGPPGAHIPPDVATCPACLAEIFDPANRRYLYPFTNCAHCGPRWTIMTRLPYDRANTTMSSFAMCDACRAEYEDPDDRRYHAQPIACPECGPHLELWGADGTGRAVAHAALRDAADAIRHGAIVAVHGLGGFHLMADARNEGALFRLREKKRRRVKPFAVMFPGLAAAARACEISALEARLLTSAEAPIVLLRRRASAVVSHAVAPRHPTIGALLPYAPLHHILMAGLGFPVVATSGNRADEPICTDAAAALERLAGVADLFLVHNRPIARPVDDSIARVLLGRELLLRRARGYAPLPIAARAPLPPILAVGAHQKNTVAAACARDIFVSQHIGDLDTAAAAASFESAIGAFERIYVARPETVACDLHPDYHSTQYAERRGLAVARVQHHHAHVASCMIDNDLDGPVLGVSWDGSGYGTDGTLWGGEFLVATADSFQRAAHLRTFALPGGERAAREPRRSALGVLFEEFGEHAFDRDEIATVRAFSRAERPILARALRLGINSPRTSSAGRLFDAVASLTGIAQRSTYEGDAAAELEFAAGRAAENGRYVFHCDPAAPRATTPGERARVIDWRPMLRGILRDLSEGVSPETIAARFHNTLVEMIVAIATMARLPRVVLTGGCFQNARLLEGAVARLAESGFHAYWHQRVPPNDGGIAVGQIAVAAAARRGAA